MVRRATFFRRNEDGASLVEGLIVFPIILLTFATFIEFGVAMVQWNQTVKAMQYGSRLLAVSDPLATDLIDYFESDYGATEGGPIITEIPPVVCTSDGCNLGGALNADGMNRLIFGTDGVCDAGAPNPGRLGMCDLNGLIRPENIRVTYYRTGLGYVGRPSGPVVSITVETRNLNFNFFFLGALIGLNNIEIPAHPVTITSEDLSNTI
ncbi:MAG: TadE/TadG family type IV pilus assembly protein [Rhodobacterales bacterium]